MKAEDDTGQCTTNAIIGEWKTRDERKDDYEGGTVNAVLNLDNDYRFRCCGFIYEWEIYVSNDVVTPKNVKVQVWYDAGTSWNLRGENDITANTTGDKYSTLQYDFRVARNSISKFLPEVCRAIVDEYKDEVISCPTDPNDWRAIADEFQKRWNVPHACGALDGKHVAIRCPPKTGSLYHNYKGFFSLVLLALVDADYKFLWIDVGGYGSNSDAQIYNASELKECLEDGTIGFPEPDPLPNDDQNMPYFLLGDDAFGLRTYLMKPFSIRGMSKEQAITNYRISRGRRVVENAFGILAQRWQIFLSTMGQVPDTVSVIIETCVCLHNLMRMRYPNLQNVQLDTEDDLHNLVPGLWRANANMHEVNSVVGPNRDTVAAKKQREYLKLYFNNSYMICISINT
ncbi:unnamed protein product [Mytilus edulis]|uniref:DDE Tnp4 domain-containing protein n=1 Tax=Mytilus edulis TaxID=6550 RepID=A0A8S3R591_MYTED|nr:unnamed protein product [Mytilus edulis]